ncbi:MAG: allantoicase [Xanthomonadales bacterium]|nr:allantoicase [Xanthomonadales bacterium]
MSEKYRNLPDVARHLSNLALPELGASILSVSDEFFAPAKRMLSPGEPVFIPDRYDEHGKWMDGWESRRKRTAGHDYCVIRICPGVISAVEIDTSFFTGNFAPEAMLEACSAEIEPDENTRWTEIVPKNGLEGDSQHSFTVNDDTIWTFIRLNIYPDGGIARLRVYGEPLTSSNASDRQQWIDLASSQAGGVALECNNMHFGDMANLLANRPVANMGDGWETRRRRHPGNDWVILKLGQAGRVCRVEVDTAFFRGNYPARCSLKGGAPGTHADLVSESVNWGEILPPVALGPDQLHIFENQVRNAGDVTHVRMDIYPDGGVARLRLSGLPATPDL